MATRKTRQYTLDEKREALELAEEVGTAEAARRLSVPKGTVSFWRFKAKAVGAKGQQWPLRVEPREDDTSRDAVEIEATSYASGRHRC